VAALGAQFYVSQEAVQRGTSFNIVHLETIQKVDRFVLGAGLLERHQLERRFRVPVSDDPERSPRPGSMGDPTPTAGPVRPHPLSSPTRSEIPPPAGAGLK